MRLGTRWNGVSSLEERGNIELLPPFDDEITEQFKDIRTDFVKEAGNPVSCEQFNHLVNSTLSEITVWLMLVIQRVRLLTCMFFMNTVHLQCKRLFFFHRNKVTNSSESGLSLSWGSSLRWHTGYCSALWLVDVGTAAWEEAARLQNILKTFFILNITVFS